MDGKNHMTEISPTAMILAAGQGLRMRPLTLQKPKPLLEVGGRTMLDIALDKLLAAGIRRAVVNVFHLADQIEEHLKKRRDIEIIISREPELLDTGGGIKNALQHFGDQPFFALNIEPPWMDGTMPSLMRMKTVWNPDKMDALLLVMPTKKAKGYDLEGDFAMERNRQLHRKNIAPPRPYIMLSAQILKPELFAAVPDKVFSNNLIWNKAEAKGTLCGLEHDGTCYYIGTPEDLTKANELLAAGKGWQ
jgi:MurNAc alpha-1-phosphate uridylyltransferase